MNDTHELLRRHASVRAFQPVELADERVREAVASAQMASTSSHVQAYSLLRVRDPNERRRLAELCGGQAQVAEAGAFFVVCADQRRHRLAAELRERPYVPNLETFLVAVIDASLFAQNLVVAFESEGLGVCYIGGLRNDLDAVAELLELPHDVFPLYGLCVGEPVERPDAKPRLPVEAVLIEGRYPSDEAVRALLAEYDGVMSSYYESRGRPGRDWSGGVAAKFREARRSHLASFYRRRGAELDG